MENLFTYVDGYCERLHPGLFSEPLNALTNLAFFIAAAWSLARPETRRHSVTIALSVLVCLIGAGSMLFHTFANRFTGIIDVLAIVLFVLVYLYATNRHFLEVRPPVATAICLLFFPYSFIVIWATLYLFPWIGESSGYIPIALLILGYAVFLRHRLPIVARDLGYGFILLALSIFFRWLDLKVCSSVPIGTHFIWHIVNAVLLGWLIYALAAHLSRSEGQKVSHQGRESN
ncbi:MAG: ceramidase domain-containing protein [Rhodobacteraceae bacterium]|nr:ceramidase domain-containing protein [Paracoccaceae bacterium]MCY4197022.1 ceramidase domain-containing protein [Paracoccaceae bacterium]